jgi:hypothetical protein
MPCESLSVVQFALDDFQQLPEILGSVPGGLEQYLPIGTNEISPGDQPFGKLAVDLPLGVGRKGECQMILFSKAADFLFRFLSPNTNHPKIIGFERLPNLFFQMRHLRNAWGTPCGKKIDQEQSSPVGFDIKEIAIQSPDGKSRDLLPHLSQGSHGSARFFRHGRAPRQKRGRN